VGRGSDRVVAHGAAVALRQWHLEWRSPSRRAGLMLLAGTSVALIGPALLLSDLTLIEQQPESQPNGALLPLASAITLAMSALFGALGVFAWLFSPERATQLLIIAWCAIVSFHYFVDGRIWRRRPPTPSAISSPAFPSSFSASPPL
jgi:hypothetical protein